MDTITTLTATCCIAIAKWNRKCWFQTALDESGPKWPVSLFTFALASHYTSSPTNQSHLCPIHLQSAVVFRSLGHARLLLGCPVWCTALHCLTLPVHSTPAWPGLAWLDLACLCCLNHGNPTSWSSPTRSICLSSPWCTSLITTVAKFKLKHLGLHSGPVT